MRRGRVLVWLLLAGSAGAGVLAPGSHEVALTGAGAPRSLRAMVPAVAPAPAGFPLVLALHGAGGSASNMADMTLLHQLGERRGFVTLYLRGTGADPRRHLTWNAGSCCGWARDHGTDDVAYVRAALAAVRDLVPVDPDRVYLVGFSNGALMAYRLAQDLPGVFAAVAAAGAPPRAHPGGAPIPAVVHFQGTADGIVPFQGGLAQSPEGSRAWAPPVRVALADLARGAGLHGPPTRRHLPDLADDGMRVHEETWGPGPEGAEVVLYTIEGGGHSWPGGPAYLVEVLGPATRDVSANELLWRFFQRHPRRSRGG